MQKADLPLLAQTTYAELLDLCDQQAFETAFGEEGTFSVKTVKSRRYWYFQPARSASDTVKPSQRYVGPETEELQQRIAQHRQARRDQRALRAMVRTLVHSYGLPAPLPAVGQVIEGLVRGGVFRLRSVLVGTVAYQTYAAMLGVRMRGSLLQTADVDVAQFLSVSIAVADRTSAMKDLLKSIDPSFRQLPSLHGTATTRYISGQQLRVEFLVPNQGRDSDEPLHLPALQTEAEPLRFLDFLIHQPVKAVLLHGNGVPVTVPAPERFAVHKLIIARRRKSQHAKSDKDLQQAATLLQVLLRKRSDDLKLAWGEAHERGPTWRKLLHAGAAQMPTPVREGLSELGLTAPGSR